MAKAQHGVSQPEKMTQQSMSQVQGNGTPGKDKPKRPVWKKWWFWVVVIILVIGVGSAALNDSADNQTAQQPEASQQADNPNGEKKDNTQTDGSATQAAPSATYGQWSVANPGTNEALDEICHKAKADLAGATDEQIEQSKQFIIAHIDNPTADQATMEGMIYHGYFLEHGAKDENLRNAGMDALQAVKYQYRGHVDETEQNATQENIRQVKEALGLQ